MIVPVLVEYRWPLLALIWVPPVALVCLIVSLALTELDRRAERRRWRALWRETHPSGE